MVIDDPYWSCQRKEPGYPRPACYAALDAGVKIPGNTYDDADPEASQYQIPIWDESGRSMGKNETAILPLEVDE